jgi:hypothetical protein
MTNPSQPDHELGPEFPATAAPRELLRASDKDRDHVAERLRHAASEGRLRVEELEQRLAAAFSARTYGELDTIVSDLPRPRPPTRSVVAARVRRRPVRALVAAAAATAAMLLAGAVGLRQHQGGAVAFAQPIFCPAGQPPLVRRYPPGNVLVRPQRSAPACAAHRRSAPRRAQP